TTPPSPTRTASSTKVTVTRPPGPSRFTAATRSTGPPCWGCSRPSSRTTARAAGDAWGNHGPCLARAEEGVSEHSGTRVIVCGMAGSRARRVVDALRDRGIDAPLLRLPLEYGVRVTLPGGREAQWDVDGAAGLEAQVMRDGMLVGFVPQIEG